MTTNPFFNPYSEQSEQDLLNELWIESIQIYGQDMYYIPRKMNNKDKIHFSSDTATYEKAYVLEAYIKSTEGFGGQSFSITSYGGAEIRNTIILTVSKTRFEDEVGYNEEIPRPREGDLIYFPLNEKCFEIKFVDNKPQFYPLGTLPVYDLHCELFAYSSQRFSTGIPEIDNLEKNHTMDALDYSILDEDGNVILDEANNVVVTEKFTPDTIDVGTNNDEFQTDGNTVIDWTEFDPFSAGKY